MMHDQFYKPLELDFFQYKEKIMSLFKKSFSDATIPRSGRFQNTSLLEKSLWKRFDLEQKKLCGKKTFACLVGYFEPNLSTVEKLLGDVGVQKTALFTDIPQVYDSITRPCNNKIHQHDFSHVIINLDSFHCLESGIDILLDFRKAFKSARIILTSEHAVKNDFGDEKSSICDVTLSLPLNSTTLNLAINFG